MQMNFAYFYENNVVRETMCAHVQLFICYCMCVLIFIFMCSTFLDVFVGFHLFAARIDDIFKL